jgi:hypothetical protein
MDGMFAGVGCIYVVVGLIIAVYPLLALGRIWLYSKQQVELLTEVRDLLRQRV